MPEAAVKPGENGNPASRKGFSRTLASNLDKVGLAVNGLGAVNILACHPLALAPSPVLWPHNEFSERVWKMRSGVGRSLRLSRNFT
jgi:hypothetical protein